MRAGTHTVSGAFRIPLSAPDVDESDVAAVVDVLRSPTLSLGPKLVEFERAVADYAGTRFAIAVNSGTSGLHLSVRALGIGPGDEVITTPFSFVASANAILYESAVPVFVDVEPSSLNLDASSIESAITPRTKAIHVVHVFGRPAAMGSIMEIARRHGLLVLEDACEAIGAEIDGHRVGAIGDAGVFAFYPNKQLTTGEGGIVVTDRAEIDALVRRFRNQGRDGTGGWLDHTELGYNYRLSDINCALGLSQLSRVESILDARASIAAEYRRRLDADHRLVLPAPAVEGGRISWFVYVVRLAGRYDRAARDRVARALNAAGIGCGRYFGPIHLQPYYVARFGTRAGAFPVCEAAAERTLALPFFNRLGEEDIDDVCRTLRGALDDEDRPTGTRE